jgi:hypothetical protein
VQHSPNALQSPKSLLNYNSCAALLVVVILIYTTQIPLWKRNQHPLRLCVAAISGSANWVSPSMSAGVGFEFSKPRGRVYTRGQWSMNELLTLYNVYMEWYAERGLGSSNYHIHHQTTTQKWDTISKRCNDMGVVITPDQCKDKWDHTRKDFKKVWDYEQNTPNGRLSFWAMTGSGGEVYLEIKHNYGKGGV